MTSALDLAKKLGLARIRKLDGSSSSCKTYDEDQKLSYLFVIDFESTCWDNKSNAPSPEIIEFPVVLLCLKTGCIVSEFQSYCLPIEQPRLSPFCTQLTGITQSMVEQGVPLKTCLMLFKQWLEKVCRQFKINLNGVNLTEEVEGNLKNATCCTWSDWDLGVCLANECNRKQLKKPEYFNDWIDIRAVYRNFYNRKPQGLNGALRDVGLHFQGREHSGIEDARNTAKLIWKMVEGGCKLDVKESTRDERKASAEAGSHNSDNYIKEYTSERSEKSTPSRSKWRNYRTGPRVIPSGIKIGPPPI